MTDQKATPSAQNDNALNEKQQKALQKQLDSLPDPLALTNALMHAYQTSQPMLQQMAEQITETFSKYQSEDAPMIDPDPFNISEASLDYMTALVNNPYKFWELQMSHAEKQAELWSNSMRKLYGEDVQPVIEPEQGDRRFKSEEWGESVLFDFIKQYYLLACDLVNKSIEQTEGLPEDKKNRLTFTARMFMDALSPSNFLLTNPEVLKETIASGGDNLVKGLKNFQHDLQRGAGELKISTTDYSAFKLGENIATTEGAVVYENNLAQLIQYAPATDKVHKTPLLIIPPWINKYYILDLRPESSFIKWAVAQGHTVFCVSWVNPDAKLAGKSFEHYMREGVIDALDQIKKITGEKSCNVVGYCLGGTLLAITMAWLAKKKQSDRIASATFLTTLIDFEHAGDMKLFMSDPQINTLEKMMSEKGILQAKELQRTFSLLRANDLIWSFVVNNYLMGREPFPFDLLFWNDDSTNMPAAMHGFYLKNMYRDNLLAKPDALEIGGEKIDISKIKTPCYFLSTKDDHIAPWKATYRTTQMVSGPKRFTLAASGHIAGVVNPPVKKKYCYWSEPSTPENHDEWLQNAEKHDGSWWPDWKKWMKDYEGGKVSPRKIGKSIEPAPGRYVKG